MKRALLILPVMLMFGCGMAHDPSTSDNIFEPVQTYTITVTVHKYNRDTCVSSGGMWVEVDTANYTNALVGCVEPTQKQTK